MVGPIEDLLTQLRVACAAVAERARHVRINHEAVPAYAAALGAVNGDSVSESETESPFTPDRAAFWVTLDAINFGSGWFPTLKKPAGKSGYFTIATALRDRFARVGPWRADELAEITPREIADVVGQERDHELMALFARSLNDLGKRLTADHAGSFEALVDSAGGSAVRLVEQLAGLDCFSDTSAYQELDVPFLKRAQIAAADLHRSKIAHFHDLDRLTMFADNLVPHVLHLDGLLEFDRTLIDRIEREELIEHGSPEEVEIRACALHAVELMVAARSDLTAAHIDELLWNRGQQRRYKSRTRHRSRCTAY